MALSIEEKQRICPSCAAVVRQTSRYCDSCGKSLNQTQPILETKVDKDRIYEEEKIRFEAQQELKKKQQFNRQLGCFLVLAAFIIFVGAAYFIQKAKQTPENTEVTLYNNGKSVGVAVDLDAFDDWRKASGTGNVDKMSYLLTAGRVLLVDSGTRALNLSEASLLYRVKILDGKYAGRTGYIEDTYVRVKKDSNSSKRQ